MQRLSVFALTSNIHLQTVESARARCDAAGVEISRQRRATFFIDDCSTPIVTPIFGEEGRVIVRRTVEGNAHDDDGGARNLLREDGRPRRWQLTCMRHRARCMVILVRAGNDRAGLGVGPIGRMHPDRRGRYAVGHSAAGDRVLDRGVGPTCREGTGLQLYAAASCSSMREKQELKRRVSPARLAERSEAPQAPSGPL